MEPYITLYYLIKYGNIGLQKYAVKEICIIIQVLVIQKLKYTRKILRQLHIFNTKAADPIFQEAYLANILVNPWGFRYTFNDMDLLLEHQNGEFKRFWNDHEFLL